ncbi:PAS domain-containing protein [Cesiribacter sp. SM1]|uniref:PAS domain-containing protein n=1 Tax=Cesiribacter sp. SM1 TaxID=2861196 RepID=UPI001CD72957|nr:PAS domain-containing protein [Cesiribacter sp. SM1]
MNNIDNAGISTPIEALFGISQEALFVIDLSNGKLLTMSPAFEQLDNYCTTVVKYWADKQKDYLIHPDDRSAREAFMQELAEAEDDEQKKLEFRILNPAGGWDSLSICFKIIKRDLSDIPSLALGRINQWAGPKSDASSSTDSKLLEEVFQKINWGLLVWQPEVNEQGQVQNFNLLLLNAKAQTLLNGAPDHLGGKKFTDLFTGDKMHKLLSSLIASFESHEPLEEEVIYDAPDEQAYYMQFIKLENRLLLNVENITDQRKSEQDLLSSYFSLQQKQKELQQYSADLEKSLLALKQTLSEKQEEYGSQLAAFADVVWEFNTITNVSKATVISNQQALPEIDLGEKLWLDAVHKDDWDMATTRWLKANVEKTKYAFRVRIKVPGDGYKWVYSKGVPVLNEEGEIRKWIGTLTDINRQVLAEEELAQAIHQLKAENPDLQQLSHLENLLSHMIHVQQNRNTGIMDKSAEAAARSI